MTVHFVGAGPGAADLITVRAQRLLSECSVCLYAGSLVPAELLAHCPPTATLIDTADLDLNQITEAIAAPAADGKDVVRLCSGDPAVFSAVAEQARRLDRLGIDYDITPGVPAFAAAAAALRRELTVPEVGQTVVLITSFTHCSKPLQNSLPTRINGTCNIFPVCVNVRTSKNSSIVPNPPGIMIKACEYFTNITLRTKK